VVGIKSNEKRGEFLSLTLKKAKEFKSYAGVSDPFVHRSSPNYLMCLICKYKLLTL
jgi:hypothetical protein